MTDINELADRQQAHPKPAERSLQCFKSASLPHARNKATKQSRTPPSPSSNPTSTSRYHPHLNPLLHRPTISLIPLQGKGHNFKASPRRAQQHPTPHTVRKAPQQQPAPSDESTRDGATNIQHQTTRLRSAALDYRFGSRKYTIPTNTLSLGHRVHTEYPPKPVARFRVEHRHGVSEGHMTVFRELRRLRGSWRRGVMWPSCAGEVRRPS
jgi:hypothetical protein